MGQNIKSIVVWILNAVIALLCILSIVGYFFGPFWEINLTYNIQPELLKEMIGSNLSGVDFEEILGEDGIDIDLTLDIETTDLFHSFNKDAQKTTELLIGNNVDKIVDQLASGQISEITEKTVRSVAKSTVKKQVNSQVKSFLTSVNPENSNLTDEQLTKRLEDANIPESYLEEEADRIIDSVYEGGADVDHVCDEVVSVVDEVYNKLQESNDEELKQAELTEEDRQSIRDAVKEELDKLAGEGGSLNPDELLANLLNRAAAELGEASANKIVPLSAESGEQASGSANEQLKETLKTFMTGYLSDDVVSNVIVWVLRAAAILLALSSVAWIYIIIKLVVKLVTHAEPTVKLKAPIIAGWLPFLLLVIIPGLIFALKGSIMSALPQEAAAVFAAIKAISFVSIGWIALLAACICAAISIFYIVIR